jgi:hypothetical protein
MKSEVYRTEVDTRDELLDHIMDVIAIIMERHDALRPATRYILTPAAKYIDVEGGIFKIYSTG